MDPRGPVRIGLQRAQHGASSGKVRKGGAVICRAQARLSQKVPQPDFMGWGRAWPSQVTPRDAVGGGPPRQDLEKPWPAGGAKAQGPEEGSWATPEQDLYSPLALDAPTEGWSLRGSQPSE